MDVEALLSWYGRVCRPLPWRATRDPYAILVSEVMLQQTQVARVIPRYEAWLERWPTAASLAGALPADVLSAWVGLGYNRRALRLREACAVVAAAKAVGVPALRSRALVGNAGSRNVLRRPVSRKPARIPKPSTTSPADSWC